MLQLLAGGNPGNYQGMTFFNPFFFLLVDSALGSLLPAFTGALDWALLVSAAVPF